MPFAKEVQEEAKKTKKARKPEQADLKADLKPRKTKMNVSIRIVAFAVISSTWLLMPANASDKTVIFYLDKHSNPVVRLDRLPKASEGVKAILALYALENGAGCEGKDEKGLVKCALTRELGLGSNCSDDHIRFVRSWFKVTPNLTSRFNNEQDKDSQKAGSLEGLCYGQPDSASWHNIWKTIKISTSKGTVTVEAIQIWGSQFGHGRVRYKNTYRIDSHTVTEVSSHISELERSSDSIFGNE